MATFQEMLTEAAANCPVPNIVKVFDPEPICDMCHYGEELNENGLCIDCQKTVDRGYQISQLAGRCANGAERDRGVRFHARMLDKDNRANWKALCGYVPGRRSVGWSEWMPEDRAVTCPKCARRLANKQLVAKS